MCMWSIGCRIAELFVYILESFSVVVRYVCIRKITGHFAHKAYCKPIFVSKIEIEKKDSPSEGYFNLLVFKYLNRNHSPKYKIFELSAELLYWNFCNSVKLCIIFGCRNNYICTLTFTDHIFCYFCTLKKTSLLLLERRITIFYRILSTFLALVHAIEKKWQTKREKDLTDIPPIYGENVDFPPKYGIKLCFSMVHVLKMYSGTYASQLASKLVLDGDLIDAKLTAAAHKNLLNRAL